MDTAKYSVIETLTDGRPVEIRALRPDDQGGLMTAVGRTSSQSIYRRFFGAKRHFSAKEIEFFTKVDFVGHVALVAIVDEGGQRTIVGGGRYVLVQPGKAELAFAVIDQYQGLSIGAALMRHLTLIAREAGITELIADVLPGNASMLKVFDKSDLSVSKLRESGIVRVSMRLK